MQDNTITMHIELSRVHAGALVQFLKRQGFSDCAQVAENSDQALRMMEATEHVRTVLAQAVALKNLRPSTSAHQVSAAKPQGFSQAREARRPHEASSTGRKA